MPNDMSLIAFDEASKVNYTNWMDLSKVPEPILHPQEEFFIKPVKTISKYKEYIFTSVDISKAAIGSINPQEIYSAFQKMQDKMYAELYEQRYIREEIRPKRKVLDLLKTPDDWVQQKLAQFYHGKTRRCILGALMEKWGMQDYSQDKGYFREDASKIAHYIKNNYPDFRMYCEDNAIIVHWNDAPGRKFHEVRDILELADV